MTTKKIILTIVLAFAILIFPGLFFLDVVNDHYSTIEISEVKISDLGTILAGCASVSSALWLWLNFMSQDMSEQKRTVENHFYRMLEIARDNTASMKSKDKEGRYVFKQIFDDFNKIYKIISSHYDYKVVNDCHKITLSWLVIFYGMDMSIRESLVSAINNYCDKSNIKQTFFDDKYNFKIIELQQISIKNKKINKYLPKPLRNWLEFDGYQNLLAHYFRHLFQVVQYVNKQTIINYEEKYHYMRTLRAQLNTFELIVLFYNCFSPYGKEWEPYLHSKSFEPSINNFLAYSSAIKTVRNQNDKLVNYDDYINKQLITKYQFFRNITMPLGNDLKVEDFFPMIRYEHIQECVTVEERKKLDQKYK